MPGPIVLIPTVIVGFLIGYVKLHGSYIAARAALAAANEFVRTGDAEAAAQAALHAGANAAAFGLVRDFFNGHVFG